MCYYARFFLQYLVSRGFSYFLNQAKRYLSYDIILVILVIRIFVSNLMGNKISDISEVAFSLPLLSHL